MALAICSMTWTVSTEATIDEETAGSVRLWWQRAPLLEVWHVVMFVSHASPGPISSGIPYPASEAPATLPLLSIFD